MEPFIFVFLGLFVGTYVVSIYKLRRSKIWGRSAEIRVGKDSPRIRLTR